MALQLDELLKMVTAMTEERKSHSMSKIDETAWSNLTAARWKEQSWTLDEARTIYTNLDPPALKFKWEDAEESSQVPRVIDYLEKLLKPPTKSLVLENVAKRNHFFFVNIFGHKLKGTTDIVFIDYVCHQSADWALGTKLCLELKKKESLIMKTTNIRIGSA